MPAPFFRIEMLPAKHGDCLWIEYGKGKQRRRILIDGGPVGTYPFIAQRLDQVPSGERSFELIVLTHVDADHVEGLVRLFADKPLPFAVDQVWFNGWRQMNAAHGLLGAEQAEFLSALLVRRVSTSTWNVDAQPWYVPKTGPLPALRLDGGMQLTLLSPSKTKLERMKEEWKKALKKAKLKPGDLDVAWKRLAAKKQFLPGEGLLGAAPNLDTLLKKQFVRDPEPPNGSSIAFLAEYGGRSALFLADAHPDVIVDSLKRLCAERGVQRLKIDVVKVAHHGSKKNTNSELLSLIQSPRWLISTNGDRFKHPDKECIARIIKHATPKQFFFNYKSKFTKPWIQADAGKKFKYEAVVRDDDAVSLPLEL